MPQSKSYKPNWKSIGSHPTPEWFKDAKFGIYTHWGPYSVPAYGPNGTWYSHRCYSDAKSAQRKYHEQHFGPLEKFGYKDFIPMFTAEKFDADEWATLFKRAGAKFAGPVAEHHDGFAMWPTRYSKWNAAKMGPKRDVVGELAAAVKKRGMKYFTAFHHAELWWWYPVWDRKLDCGDPKYSGLYGPIHKRGEQPDERYLKMWLGKLKEVIGRYDPDLVWFDFALGQIREKYRREFMAYYYNLALERDKEVVVMYKHHSLPPGAGVIDYELGRMDHLTYNIWITDTSVDDQGAWCYVKGVKYKPAKRLVNNLIDRVSKNGYLLLNVGPRPDGTIPEGAKKSLLGLGDWLRVNGEAIYGTRPWSVAGEGPTKLEKEGGFNEGNEVGYTGKDIRFTVKGNALYATCLGWPAKAFTIRSLGTVLLDRPFKSPDPAFYADEIKTIRMLGVDKDLKWKMTRQGLRITRPDIKPCEHAFVFKINRK
jgi:alpha-L-fucosidase